jgi:hypothetical protein
MFKTFNSKAQQYTFYSGRNIMEIFEKTSTEEVIIDWEFAPVLPTGQTLDSGSCDVKVADEDGENVTSTIVDDVDVVESTKVRAVLKAGTGGKYTVQFICVTTPGAARYEGYVLLCVKDVVVIPETTPVLPPPPF